MSKCKLIHDNIHSYMQFEPLCLQIIDTPEFQRLRNLKQLGAANYVFPCGNHSRFEHSLGVAYLSEQMLNNIKLNQPELNINNREILLVKIAGLVHDLGHGCFSHFFDNIFLKDVKSENKEHENRSIWILKNMIKKYNLDISEEELDFIDKIINSSSDNCDWKFQIVANAINGLDTDKFDYLQRDTKALGLSYSIDSSRILSQARVINNSICYPDKEVFTIYEIFHTRYRLHKQIYTHPVIQQIEYMILDVLHLADPILKISNTIENVEEFIKIDDTIIDKIYNSNDEKLWEAKKIIDNLKKRNLYSFISEKNFNKTNIKKKLTVDDIIEFNCDSLSGSKLIKNDIILHYLCLGYTGYPSNPVDNILFYNLNNSTESFKQKKENVSKLIPDLFNENIIRIFSRNDKNDKLIKDIFDKLIEKYNYV